MKAIFSLRVSFIVLALAAVLVWFLGCFGMVAAVCGVVAGASPWAVAALYKLDRTN